MKKTLEDFNNMTPKGYKEKNFNEIEREAKRNIKNFIEDSNEDLKKLNKFLVKGIIKQQKYDSDLEKIKSDIHLNHLEIDEKNRISETKKTIEEEMNNISKEELNSKQRPFFIGWNGVETLAKLFEKYPPLLSVDGQAGQSIFKKFTVFDKDHPADPWLNVNKEDPHYDWMFSTPFQPGGITHFITVDLKNMADSKQLDPMEAW